MITTTPQLSGQIPYITRSNVQSIAQAKVIFLLANNFYSSDYIKNQEVIKEFYEEKDVILVEDDASKRVEELNKRQISNLKTDDYRIEGWEIPAISSRTHEICQGLENVEDAVKKLRVEETLKPEEKKECFDRLREFTDYLKTIGLEVPAPKWLFQEIKGELLLKEKVEKMTFLDACSDAVRKVLNGYTAKVLPKRREGLKSRIDDLFQNANVGKIFVCASFNLVEPYHPDLKPQAEELINSLGTIPFIVINPSIRWKNAGS